MRRSVALGETWRTTTSLVAPGFRAYVVTAVGLRFDSTVLLPAFPMHVGTAISFQLSGRLHLQDRSSTLHEDCWMIEPKYAWREIWEGGVFRVLMLEWSQNVLVDEAYLGRVTSSFQEPLRALADAIESGQAAEAESLLPAVLNTLSAEGLKVPPIPQAPSSAAFTRALEVLNAARTSLHAQPQWVDAAVHGRSERQLRRDLAAFFQAHQMPDLGYRDLLLRERLTGATSLLGSNHRIEQVASAVGYGSSTALGLALSRAGLPSATDLQRRLRCPN